MSKTLKLNSAEIFDGLLSHLVSDVALDRTHGGGYTPTARVLQQRDWHIQQGLVKGIGLRIRADFYMENYIEGSHVGFRDNRDPVACDVAYKALIVQLRAMGCLCYPVIFKGETLIKGLNIRFNARRAKLVAEMHADYVTALTAMKMARQSGAAAN